MINIINNILSSNGYEQIQIELPEAESTINLFRPSAPNIQEEFFISIQLNTQSDVVAKDLLEVKAQVLFDTISHSGKVDQTFEKNCTMLICHKEDKISRQTIFSLEEDQYNFKKNVIAYAQEEFEALDFYLAHEKIKKITNNVINNVINSDGGKAFLEFKENHKHDRDHYSLLLKIALKLPFITYDTKEQELTNLLEKFYDELSHEDSLLYEQLLAPEADWEDENIMQQVELIWGLST